MQHSWPNPAPVEPVATHRPKPRRRKPARAEIENDLLEQPRWSGLRQQQRLQSRNQTQSRTLLIAADAEPWWSWAEAVARSSWPGGNG